jgi:hypothetical protein
MRRGVALAAILGACALGGCGSDGDGAEEKNAGTTSTTAAGSLPQGSEAVELDPADFTTDIDNPYFPLRPGSRWVFREGQGADAERVEITVTNDTKKIEGIDARVVRDTVTSSDGKLIEDTHDWYAQDADGNVWYMGEATTEYEDGKPKTTEGSWEAGVDGAEPGVIMPARPRPGLAYRQEYYEGHAEDRAKVVSITAKASVPFGTFDHTVETEDVAPLGGGTVEHKYYARGVGLVLAVGSGGGREELISFRR